MNEHHDQDKDIRDALQMNVPQEEPSPELMRNLRVMASNAGKARRPWWQSRLTAAVTAAAAVMVVTLTMLPSQATAKTYDKLVAAAKQVNTFQFAIRTDEDGKHEELTIAGANGRVGMRAEDGTMVRIDRAGISFYDPEENVATHFNLGHIAEFRKFAQYFQSGISEAFNQIDLHKMLQDYEKQYGKEHIYISGVRPEGGRNVYTVKLSSPNEPDRINMTVDAGTDLPIQIQCEERDKTGDWNVESTIDMRFGEGVDSGVLDADFPADAKNVEINLDSLASGAANGLESMAPLIKRLDPNFKSKIPLNLGSRKSNADRDE